MTQVEHPTVKGRGSTNPQKGGQGYWMRWHMSKCNVKLDTGSNGLRDACPRGRYGGTLGLQNVSSVAMRTWYICPHGSYLGDSD